MTRPKRKPMPAPRQFADLAEVPAGVELCQDDRCNKFDGGLHAAHPVVVRGHRAPIAVCRKCLGNYPADSTCRRCKPPAVIEET